MSSKLSARDFIEKWVRDIKNANRGQAELCEDYASHRLEAYKAELVEYIDARIEKYEQETRHFTNETSYKKAGKLAAFRNMRFHLTKRK